MPDLMRAAPAGYSLGKSLHSGTHSEVWEAVLDSDRSEVVIKSYRADRTTEARPRALREFEATCRVSGHGIPRALAVDRSTDRVLLVLERLPGTPLAQILQEGPLEIRAWLDLAIRVTEILVRIHAARVLHKDLTPGNLLIDRGSARVWICDFGLAQELGSAEHGSPLSGTLEGTLQYLAPEQTGRMNRGCDFRSDLYSLGATLYHALTGRPPFASSDPLELIHAHIARIPDAPQSVRSGVPPALSALVLKLLRKEPEERYQSATALRSDLERCRERFASGASLGTDFELGGSEAPDHPRFAVKLYGREREVAQLRSHYATATRGQMRALWLRGEPGAGKSALIDELRPELAQTGGYLMLGKADPYRDRPYDAWLSALGALVHQMLIESDARLERWRRELLGSLGNIAGALVELVPDLTFILGEVPPVPALGPRETQARLSLALQRFVSVCATPQHPLVIFLDDLQWSDGGSQALLEGLLSSGEPAALLLIGAYRSSAVGGSHALPALFSRVAQRGAVCETLDLGPLASAAVVAMLADALERPPEAVSNLAELIERKTGNTPLLVRQFVEHVHGRGLLQHRAGHGWSWDAAEVAAADIPDGAVELMTAKIEKLAPELRGLLEFASCVGDEFDVELLSELSRGEREPLKLALFALSDAGLIAPCAHGFRFVHDRIREAAQQLLSEEQRARIHFDTARVLLERTADEERDAWVFEIVEHLNRGLVHISEELRVTAMELDLRAGTRALASGAAATACGYLDVARRLFREEDWRAHWTIGFQIHLQSAEGHFQTQEFDRALALLDALDRHSLTPIEYAQVAIKRVQVLTLTQGPIECGPYVLAVLRRLGVRWPLHPSRLRGWLAIQWVRFKLRRRPDQRLLEPAKSADATRRATQLFINASGGVRSRIDAELSVLAGCLSMRRALRLGYIGAPGFTLAGYTVFMHARIGDCALSRRLAGIALELSERVPDPILTPRTQFMIHALLEPWLMRRRHALASMDRTAQVVSEVGDREFEYYARFLTLLFRGLGGDPIPQIAQLMEQLAGSVGRSGHWYPQPEAVHGVYNLLTEDVDDAEVERRLAASEAWMASNSGTEIFIRTAWLLVLCVRGRHDIALAQSDVIASTLFRVTPYVHVADHTFLRGLCSAALAAPARGARRRQLRRDLDRSLRRLQTWAKGGPDFIPMQVLLEAETARLDANAQGARVLYERAAQAAAEQEFPHVAAFAYERHARMLIGARRETEAAGVLKDAIAWYRRWGAAPKVEALVQERQRLLAE
jgi:tRNA A-37 threonylcarbamoyl transferase component Bud32